MQGQDQGSEVTPYRMYILTIWNESHRSSNLGEKWRFKLEAPQTQWVQGFSHLEALLEGLMQILKEMKGEI